MVDKTAWESLEGHQAFTTYATQADAAAASAPGAKDYVATQDEKGWHDPKADTTEDGRRQIKVGGVPHVMYPAVFTGVADAAGIGIVEELVIPVAQAKKVNIKPTGTGMTNVPGTGNTVKVPLKPMTVFQKIQRRSGVSNFWIRNTDVAEESNTAVDLSPTLAALAALDAKVDKILAKLGIS